MYRQSSKEADARCCWLDADLGRLSPLPTLCPDENTGEAHYREARRDGGSTATPFIHEEQVSSKFHGKYDCFSLARGLNPLGILARALTSFGIATVIHGSEARSTSGGSNHGRKPSALHVPRRE